MVLLLVKRRSRNVTHKGRGAINLHGMKPAYRYHSEVPSKTRAPKLASGPLHMQLTLESNIRWAASSAAGWLLDMERPAAAFHN